MSKNKKEKDLENNETKGIERYWCKQCECIHCRFRNIKKQLKSKIFIDHLEHREILSNSEMFIKNFMKKWNQESNKKKEIIHSIIKINE